MGERRFKCWDPDNALEGFGNAPLVSLVAGPIHAAEVYLECKSEDVKVSFDDPTDVLVVEVDADGNRIGDVHLVEVTAEIVFTGRLARDRG